MSSDKKNNPTGIRFDEEKTKFAMEKLNIRSKQKLVNHFIDNFWWRYHIEEVPTHIRQNPTTPKESFNKPAKEEIKAEVSKGQIEALESDINDFQKELDNLGKGQWAERRRTFLEGKISQLKTKIYNLKNQ